MSRPVYTYTVPPRLAAQIGVSSFALVEISSDEEVMAANRAKSDQVKLAVELVKESLRGIDDRKVSLVDGTLDMEWAKLHPKARNLVMQAYAELHNVRPDEASDFLQSRQVTLT